MSTRFRSVFAVFVIGMALAAAAVAPARSSSGSAGDFVGTWITWRRGAEGDGRPCRRLYVTSESVAARDGTWDAPGWNGLVTGDVALDAGHTVWRGEWRDGRLAGTFALTLRGGDAFEGTFAGPGEAPRPWSGRRDTGGAPPDVPCRLR
jgi:hypothetical protein